MSFESQEEQFSRQLDREGAKHNADRNTVQKFLLLGTGESGKSTLFKQLTQIYGEGFSAEERKPFVKTIFKNTVTSMQTLVREALSRGMTEFRGREYDCTLNGLEKSIDFFTKFIPGSPITVEVAYHIQQLWSSQGIRNVFKLRSSYQFPDAAEYFFNRLDDFVSKDYCPTYADILRSRVRTTGVAETTFEIEQNVFSILDVGGQRCVSFCVYRLLLAVWNVYGCERGCDESCRLQN